MDEDGLKREQKVITQQYHGDIAEYRRDMNAKASLVYRWKDIHASAVAFPTYEEEALRQIEFQLGYPPSRQITLPIEPFIRLALYEYDFIHGDFDKLCLDCAPHIEHILKNIDVT